MKMKRLKKFVSMLTAVALCALLPGATAITASADTPVTYYVKYVSAEEGWHFQTGGWSDSEYNRDLYYMFEEIKDGDIVVVDSNGSGEFAKLDFSKHISNLTVVKDSHAVVSAPSIDLFFGHGGSSTAVTGVINNAYMYDSAGLTFHSDIHNLEIIDTRGQQTGTINTSAGSVGHVTCKTESGYIYFELYNVAAGKLNIEYGTLKTDPAYYSTTPDASQTTVTPAPAETSSDNTAATQQSSASADEYDAVPKTGESNTILLLTGIAVLCLMGRRALKKVQ